MDPSLQQLLTRVDRIPGLRRDLRESFGEVVGLAKIHTAMAVTLARKTLSIMIEDVYRREVNEPGTAPLDSLLSEGKKKGIFPERIVAYSQTVKDLGNIGAHRLNEKIDAADVIRSLESLLPILEWYAVKNQPVSSDPGPAAPVSPSYNSGGGVGGSRPPIKMATRPTAPPRPSGSSQFATVPGSPSPIKAGSKPPTIGAKTSNLTDQLCWSVLERWPGPPWGEISG